MPLSKKYPFQLSCERGFTLFELCISILIIGIFLTGTLLASNMYFQAQKVKSTRVKVDQIANALSAYVQTHYRLPCPADPGAAANLQGRESGGGNCFVNNGKLSDTYWATQGVVPWKELGIPQDMVVDAWNRYITYKPAPNLTINTASSDMQNAPASAQQDVHNACRSALWFDDNANHVNRAKALFCCNASPNSTYLTNNGQPGTLPANWRNNGVLTTTNTVSSSGTGGLANTDTAIISNSWRDDNIESSMAGNVTNTSGSFSMPNVAAFPDSPLIRATSNAVTLISHGSNGNMAFMPGSPKATVLGGSIDPVDGEGSASSDSAAATELQNVWPPQKFAGVMGLPKAGNTFNVIGLLTGASDDLVTYIRSDQLFGRVGGTSCEKLPVTQPYECLPQDISETNGKLKDPLSGTETVLPKLYALSLPLNGKYELKSIFTRKPSEAKSNNSLGNYTIAADGTLQNVQMVLNNAKTTEDNTTKAMSADVDGSELGVGVFILFDGADANPRLSLPASDPNAIIFGNKSGEYTLKFQKSARDPTPAKITDATPPVLAAYKNGSSMSPVILRGRSNVNPYHMYSNLNDGQVNRIMNKDNASPDSNAALPYDEIGVVKNPDGTKTLNVAFEDLNRITCYYNKARDDCKPNMPVADRYVDEYGGYWAKVGDEDYDDVVFGYNLVACPKQ